MFNELTLPAVTDTVLVTVRSAAAALGIMLPSYQSAAVFALDVVVCVAIEWSLLSDNMVCDLLSHNCTRS